MATPNPSQPPFPTPTRPPFPTPSAGAAAYGAPAAPRPPAPRTPAAHTRRVVLTAVAIALVGAVAASLLIMALTLAGVAIFPRVLVLQSPVIFPYTGRRVIPLAIVAFLIGLVVLAAFVALAARLGARSASPERGGAAVMMAVWLGTILGGAFAAIFAATLRLVTYGMPLERVLQQAYASFGSGAYWGILFGWVVGLGAAIAFAGGRRHGATVLQPSAPNNTPGGSPNGTHTDSSPLPR